MYFFDNKFLQQYIDAGAKLKIYSNSDWHTISDLSDLKSAKFATAYSEYGEATQIPYKQIELIQVNGSVITIENLQSMMTGKQADDQKKPASEKEPGPEDDFATDEEPDTGSKKKEPDLSWYSPHYDLGRSILKEYMK